MTEQHRPPRAGPSRGRRARHQGAVTVHRAEGQLRLGDRRARRAQRRLRHQRRAQDGSEGLDHLRADVRRERAGRRLAGRRGARRHRADVQGHRVRPDDGRHEGDRHAVDRLPERVRLCQDPHAGCGPREDDGQDRAARTDHPSPRRTPMLMLQKSYAEGMRALVLYTATVQDEVALAEAASGARRSRRARPRRTPQRLAAAHRQGLRIGDGPTSCSGRSRCRPSAARATCRTIRSSSTSATPRSTRFTRARRPSRAWICSSARSCETKARR